MSEDWFARRTHHWDELSLDELLDRKRATGNTVSLVVPARDEAATIGPIVTRSRELLMDTAQLVDEVVVIDSDSSDATFDVAADAGAVVHRCSDVRPDLGTVPGKGEAMWKAQFVTRGDVLVFMDADLVEWDTHFVPGLLGPLLTTPEVQLVKGFYERPMLASGGGGPYDGGRVTELVARPLIALDWPDLAGLVQPLAGEWAVRRDHFAQLAVPTGYAVELAALIDTLERRGVDAIAQVDLGRRAHKHQTLHDLGAMAVQLLAAAQRRRTGGDGGGAGALDDVVALRQYSGAERGLRVHERTVRTGERPPAVAVPDEEVA
ncbi:glucosyl-3-phosphoglycerate synthase [Nocardioides massiliensis]|uniref:Glucosyl-3-phosphoglycerate synthase n=1 Tax=Nocardioides massiliensis TaxID=1325935 RepID=A0ABT9NUX4_9ACTN|nr:glucosyl-3-phosphoglycerate synthase [Nocardioides massiliensis]MDP9824208.1 glucosyl-3-phosphoglycerate synthase [Nocardioides massiliensis]